MQENKITEWEDICLSESEKIYLQKVINEFNTLIPERPDLTHVTSQPINMGNKCPVETEYYRYDKVRTEITKEHVNIDFQGQYY